MFGQHDVQKCLLSRYLHLSLSVYIATSTCSFAQEGAKALESLSNVVTAWLKVCWRANRKLGLPNVVTNRLTKAPDRQGQLHNECFHGQSGSRSSTTAPNIRVGCKGFSEQKLWTNFPECDWRRRKKGWWDWDQEPDMTCAGFLLVGFFRNPFSSRWIPLPLSKLKNIRFQSGRKKRKTNRCINR